MGNIISEGLEFIGSIDDNGFIYDKSGSFIAEISDSGYITEIGGGDVFGKIDSDGTIRDASLNSIGRIQADGYVYIRSRRICRVSSKFIENITPDAWNAGKASTYSGRQQSKVHEKANTSTTGIPQFLFSPFFIKLIIGIIIGVICMANGIGGPAALIGGPVLVFMFCFFAKIF